MRTLRLGYSPCPNDTFLFYALAHNRLPNTSPFRWRVEHYDIATLNELAGQKTLELTKLSALRYGMLQEAYDLLPCGAAFGLGYGPLVVTARPLESPPASWKIGLPGRQTTAHLLTRLWCPDLSDPVFLPFSEILGAIHQGKLEAGVIIHESRFTYQKLGLHLHLDLGAWWQIQTGQPLPLGLVCARRDLSSQARDLSIDFIRQSLIYAQTHPEAPLSYMRQYAQETEDLALQEHVRLYVNEYSLEMGEAGRKALDLLLHEARSCGLIAR